MKCLGFPKNAEVLIVEKPFHAVILKSQFVVADSTAKDSGLMLEM